MKTKSETTPDQKALLAQVNEAARRQNAKGRIKIAKLFKGIPPYNEHEVRTPHVKN
jgi:hypothetical protein